MVWKLFFCSFAVLVISYQSLGFGGGGKPCANKKLTIHTMRDCEKGVNPHGRLLNFSLTLTDECHFIPRLCFIWKKKDLNKIFYNVTKVGTSTTYDGFRDLCKDITSNDVKNGKDDYPILKDKNIDCPTSVIDLGKGVKCVKEGKSVKVINNMVWAMAKGEYKGIIEVFHTDHPKDRSCFFFHAEAK